MKHTLYWLDVSNIDEIGKEEIFMIHSRNNKT